MSDCSLILFTTYSKPTSPGNDPSRLAGFFTKGSACDISSFLAKSFVPAVDVVLGEVNAEAIGAIANRVKNLFWKYILRIFFLLVVVVYINCEG